MAKKPAVVKAAIAEDPIPPKFEDAVKQLEAAANDAAAVPQVDQQVAPAPKLMIVFNFVRNYGTSGTSRVFVTGLFDLRREEEIHNVERLIIEGMKGEYSAVLVPDWKTLEG